MEEEGGGQMLLPLQGACFEMFLTRGAVVQMLVCLWMLYSDGGRGILWDEMLNTVWSCPEIPAPVLSMAQGWGEGG